MAQIISATTKFAGAGMSAKRQRFLSQAADLLYRARQAAAAQDFDEALELSYQAALRTAGAWVAGSPVASRKRLPSSAWDRLELVGPDARAWVDRLRRYSRQRSRVITGLDDGADAQSALELMALAGEFFVVVSDAYDIPAAA